MTAATAIYPSMNRHPPSKRRQYPFQGKVVNIYQTGLIPVLNYKVEF